jgi:hypothetical protein
MEGSSVSSSTNAESSSVDSGTLTVMLTEYKSLRDEQLKRADHRITLLTTSITVSGALLATGLQLKSAYVLLTLPLVSSLFGLLIIFHHRAIRDIGLYIKNHIESSICRRYPGSIGWETSHAAAGVRFRRILGSWHFPIILLTLVPSVVALIFSWAFKLDRVLALLLTAVDSAMLVFFLYEYMRQLVFGRSLRLDQLGPE